MRARRCLPRQFSRVDPRPRAPRPWHRQRRLARPRARLQRGHHPHDAGARVLRAGLPLPRGGLAEGSRRGGECLEGVGRARTPSPRCAKCSRRCSSTPRSAAPNSGRAAREKRTPRRLAPSICVRLSRRATARPRRGRRRSGSDKVRPAVAGTETPAPFAAPRGSDTAWWIHPPPEHPPWPCHRPQTSRSWPSTIRSSFASGVMRSASLPATQTSAWCAYASSASGSRSAPQPLPASPPAPARRSSTSSVASRTAACSPPR